MKKLLGMLGAVALVATTSSAVTSCGIGNYGIEKNVSIDEYNLKQDVTFIINSELVDGDSIKVTVDKDSDLNPKIDTKVDGKNLIVTIGFEKSNLPLVKKSTKIYVSVLRGETNFEETVGTIKLTVSPILKQLSSVLKTSDLKYIDDNSESTIIKLIDEQNPLAKGNYKLSEITQVSAKATGIGDFKGTVNISFEIICDIELDKYSIKLDRATNPSEEVTILNYDELKNVSVSNVGSVAVTFEKKDNKIIIRANSNGTSVIEVRADNAKEIKKINISVKYN
ncbi:lipoprotein [Spiroplasma endosymbiont of Diplazon laetatorius]|uniref:lipoprotein n=1 Tax=Spiroplasma endosymbiont of Diplazon laetatorius TaxID=3066322 RepID=UPI0030CBBA05